MAGVTIYLDENGNGQLDGGETSTVTAADGSYQFSGLDPGAYLVREIRPLGYLQSSPVTPPAVWVQQSSEPGSDQIERIAVDLDGNRISVGQVSDGDFYGHTPVGTAGWILKQDAAGDVLWVDLLDTSETDVAYSVDTDSLGNIYVVGYTAGTLGSAALGGEDAWIAKYTPAGSRVWITQFGSADYDRAMGVAVGSDDYAYVAGYMSGAAASDVGRDGFLARVDPNGAVDWIEDIATTEPDEARDVATDGNEVYVGGTTDGELGSHEYGDYLEYWTAHYDQQGNRLWLKQYTVSGSDIDLVGVGAGSGLVFTSGSAVSGDAFYGAYYADGTGVALGGYNVPSSNELTFRDSTVDENGVAWVAGYSDYYFEGIRYEGGQDGILWKKSLIDSTTWPNSAFRLGTSSDEWFNTIDMDGNGNLYLAGYTTHDLFGEYGGGSYDTFWMKVDPGLSSPHIVNVAEDEVVENVDFGAEPMVLEVTETDPAEYEAFTEVPTEITVDFSFPIDPASVDAADLTVNGVAATAFSIVDSDTTVFTMPSLVDGKQTVEIAAGSILSDEAVPIEVFSMWFWIDTTPPVVTVDTQVTFDRTPSFSGTVADTGATIEVTIDGQSFAAYNNLDGTWTLDEDKLSGLLPFGVHDVAVTAADIYDNVGVDSTTGELDIRSRGPIVVGAGNAPEGQPYTINLGVADPTLVDSWTIDWGDGAVDTLVGHHSTASHVYADGPATFPLTASAVIDGQATTAVVVLDVADPLDPDFAGGKIITSLSTDTDTGRDAVIQPDGKTIVVGSGLGSDATFDVVRYNTDGSLDATFGSGGIVATAIGSRSCAYAVVLQPNGKIVVAGSSEGESGQVGELLALARYNSDGSLDTTFGVGGMVTTDVTPEADFLRDMALSPDGKITAVGVADHDPLAVRFNADGSLDTTFSGDGIAVVEYNTYSGGFEAMGLLDDGSLIAGGYNYVLYSQDLNLECMLARFAADGQLDTGFGDNGFVIYGGERVEDLLIDSQDCIVVTGNSSNTTANLSRYQLDGTLDATFGQSGRVGIYNGSSSLSVEAVALRADGTILMGGWSYGSAETNFDFMLLQYNEDGTPDVTLDGDGRFDLDIASGADYLADVVVSPDGKVTMVGHGKDGSTDLDIALARLQFHNVTVEDVAPSISVAGPDTIDAGALCTLDFLATDPGDDVLQSWQIDWGDGIVQTLPALDSQATHVFFAAGTPTITVTAHYDEGSYPADGLSVTVNDVPRGSIAGTVWNDLDGDGIKETGEPDLSDWVVYLDLNSNGALDSGELTQTSGADGSYSFLDVPARSYTLAIVGNDAWHQTLPSGSAYTVDVQADQTTADRNFGLQYRTGDVAGTVWVDLDGDTLRDLDEPAADAWTVFIDVDGNGLLDSGEPSASTNPDGTYALIGVMAGTYDLRVELPSGIWEQTLPSGGGARSVLIPDFAVASDVDFAVRPVPSGVMGTVFHDLDDDGNQGPTELGLAGWTVYWDRDGDGQFEPGNSGEIDPTDYPVGTLLNTIVPAATLSNAGNAGYPNPDVIVYAAQGSTGDRVIGNYYQEMWTAGQQFLRVDFAQPVANVAINAIGVVDRAEAQLVAYNSMGSPIASDISASLYPDSEPTFPRWDTISVSRASADIAYVRVLCSSGSVMFDNLVFGETQGDIWAVTDADGDYILSGLPAGEHVIAEVRHPGWPQTYPAGNGTHVVTLVGDVVAGVDFGNGGPVPGIYGAVWNDADADSSRDDSEGGLTGWTVYIDDDGDGEHDPEELSTTTDNYGAYGFPNLGAGTFTVAIVVESGGVPTSPAGASQTVTISDAEVLDAVDFGAVMPRVYVDINAALGGDGSSWATALNALDLGIDRAVELAGLGVFDSEQIEIWIAEGTYVPTRPLDAGNLRTATFFMQSNTSLMGGFAGTEVSAEERVRNGDGLLIHETVLSGDLGDVNVLTDNAYTVVLAHYKTDVVLDGLTITNGYANGSGAYQDNSGGGVFLNHGSTTINDVTFTENYCIYYGGALRPLVATVTIDGCRFFDNHAILEGTSTPQGGAINLANSNTTYITNSVFEGNTAYDDHGAIDMYYTPTIIEDCVFRGNEASDGAGATHNYGSSVIYNRVLFEGNSTEGPGGAVYTQFDATFNDCSFLANQAGEVGGGVYATNSAYVLFEQCEFVGNQSGIYGGGLYVSSADVNRSTITGNHSNRGGGLASGGNNVTLTSSIVALNTADTAGADVSAPYSGRLTAQYSLIGSPSYWYEAGDYRDQYGNIIGTTSDPIDPLFVRNPSDGGNGWGNDPATPGVDESANDDYGDLHPKSTSLAVNAGLEADPPLQTTDLDGHPRVMDGIIDIGAYESENIVPVAVAEGPYGVVAGGTVTLDGSASYDPGSPGGAIASYAWDFDNDGLFDDATGATPVFSAAGLTGGTLASIALQVTDSDGATHSDSATIIVFLDPLDLTGTEGDDIIVVTPGSAIDGIDHVVEINGETFTYSPFVGRINIDGLDGVDEITINGTAEDETVTFSPDSVDMVVGHSYQVHGTNHEFVTVNAGAGSDSVAITGAGDHYRLHSYPDYVTFRDYRTTFKFHAEGFESVTAETPTSGRDYAYVHGAPGKDRLDANPERVIFTRGVGAANETQTALTGFQRVYSYGTLGDGDEAVLTGATDRSNSFYGYADYSLLTESRRSFYFYARGFDTVTATSPADGYTFAYFHDSSGTDSFTADPTAAAMDRPASWSDTTAYGFKRVYAYSQLGGDDTAQLTGSDSGNLYYGYPTYSTLTDDANSFYHYVEGFRSVTAIGSQDAASNDRAYFYDSTEADTFLADGVSGIMQDTAQQVYRNEALYFDIVHANSTDEEDAGDEIQELSELAYELIRTGTW